MNRYSLINFRDRLKEAAQMYLHTSDPDPYQVLFECGFTNEQSDWHRVYNWLYVNSKLVRTRQQVHHMFNQSLDNIDRLIAEAS